MILWQLLAITILGAIAYQDIKDRMVFLVLFPLAGAFLALMHWHRTVPETFLIGVGANLFLVSSIMLILWLYTRYVRGKQFLNVSFGLGDVLFLYALALGFPSMTFVVVLAFSLCFAIAVQAIVILFDHKKTVPLAGYMSIFLVAVILCSLGFKQIDLYAY